MPDLSSRCDRGSLKKRSNIKYQILNMTGVFSLSAGGERFALDVNSWRSLGSLGSLGERLQNSPVMQWYQMQWYQSVLQRGSLPDDQEKKFMSFEIGGGPEQGVADWCQGYEVGKDLAGVRRGLDAR